MGKLNYRIPNTNDFREVYVKVTDTLPIGAVCQYGGSIAPSGYLMCNGQAVSRTTYADLFEAIGTSFGSGDGLTTFNLPNFNGRVPVGLDGTDTSFDTIGETGGGTAASGTGINVRSYLVTNFIIKASKKVALDKGNVVDSLDGADTDSAPSIRAVNEGLANFGKKLWEGNFTSGSITVEGISNYHMIAVSVGGALCTGLPSLGGNLYGGYASYNYGVMTYRLNYNSTNETLTIDNENKGGSDGSSLQPITAIYGIF